MTKVASGDYPCWVYDPTGVNPPVLVQNDPQYVALLQAPLPSTAVPNTPPTTAPPPVITVPQPPPGPLTSVGGTTQVPPGARFTKSPTTGTAVLPVVVNTRPNVRPKNG